MNAKKLLPWTRWKVLLRRFSRALSRSPVSPAAAPGAAELAGAQACEDDAPRACGWFDSSHDLQQGLRVQEHLSPDTLARELPLAAWLDLQLSGWRATSPGAVPPAFTSAT